MTKFPTILLLTISLCGCASLLGPANQYPNGPAVTQPSETPSGSSTTIPLSATTLGTIITGGLAFLLGATGTLSPAVAAVEGIVQSLWASLSSVIKIKQNSSAVASNQTGTPPPKTT